MWLILSKSLTLPRDLLCNNCRKQEYSCRQVEIIVHGVGYLDEYRRKERSKQREIAEIARKYKKLSAFREDFEEHFVAFTRAKLTQQSSVIKELKEQEVQLINLYYTSLRDLFHLHSQPFQPVSPQIPPQTPQVLLQPKPPAPLPSISTANPRVVTIHELISGHSKKRYLPEQLRGLNPGSAHFVWSGNGQERVVCIGGNESRRCYMLVEQGEMWEIAEMQSMLWKRGKHGLVVFEGHAVAIGGWGKRVALSACEKLNLEGDLAENAWEPFPPLTEARFELNPCVYNNQIYACGGHCSSIEIYSPQISKFRLISAFLRPSCPTISLEFKGELLILTGEETHRLAEDGTLSTCWKRPNYISWSESPPLASEDRLYVVERGDLKVFVLPDGRIRDVEYWPQTLD